MIARRLKRFAEIETGRNYIQHVFLKLHNLRFRCNYETKAKGIPQVPDVAGVMEKDTHYLCKSLMEVFFPKDWGKI